MRALLALLSLLVLPGTTWAKAPPWGDQVVNVIVSWQTWDGVQPWTKTNPAVRQAHATVVPGLGKSPPVLLTQASVVENATLVRVKKHGEPQETLARIVTVDREANLALLAVDEAGFFGDLKPAHIATRAPSEGDVTFVRWKANQLEATQGRIARAVTVVSRTGVSRYPGFRVTTDLSGGGWAEPVFVGATFVGMTLAQDGSEAQIVGAEFLRGWLQESGTQGRTRDWIGDLGVAEQDLRAPALASWLGLDAPRGLLILSVEQGSSACGVLRRGDVLLSVDGHELDGDGNVRDPVRGLVAFEGLLAEFHPGEELPVRILRDKKVLDLRIPLRHYTGDSWLIPHGRLDPPPFLMAGGLVFREFDESYTARSTELRVAFQTARKAQQPERRRIVVLGTVLPDPFNLGYHQLSDLRVVAVNGQGVDSVDEVRAALQTPKDGYHVVEFQPNGRMNQLVLDAQGFEDATTRIAENYGLLETFRPSVPPPPLGDCKE